MSQLVDVNVSMSRELKKNIPFQSKRYNDYRVKIEASLQQADDGKLISFTLDELESLEDMDIGNARDFLEARRKEVGV